jgi:4-hydroxybenzoate polyprenyltransferase
VARGSEPDYGSVLVTLRALLRLCRIPNVFTACANAVAGILLARDGGFQLNDALVVCASAALYLAGMVLNDYFDRKVDAVERPERPIPSGDVSAKTAAALGGTLLILGIALAGLRGAASLGVAAALALAIVGYDALLKATPLGPVAMGSCRFLNVLLGMSVAWPSGALWMAPLVMGLYTVAITVLSRDEVMGGGVQRTRKVVLALLALAPFTMVALIAIAGRAAGGMGFGVLCSAPFVAFLLVRARANFAPLWQSAAAPSIGRAIGGGILLMPAIDASFVAAIGQLAGALAVLALTVPAVVLKRWYYLT